MRTFKHILTLLSLVLLGGLAYYTASQSGFSLSAFLGSLGINTPEPITTSEPGGVLIITGVNREGSELEQKLPQNYALDILSEAPIWEQIGDISQGTVSSAFIEPTDVSRPTSAFVRSVILRNSERRIKSGVIRADMPDRRVEILAIDSMENPQHFAWSEARQLLAYEAFDTDLSTEMQGEIQNRTIKVYNPADESVVFEIHDAIQPFWTPDGSQLVYLTEDGIHMHHMSTGAESLLIGVDGYDPENRFLDANTKIGMSPDGKYLAWTSPANSALHIFEVVSWEPFSWKTIQRDVVPGTQFYWPMFSPDSKFIAVQAIDGDVLGGERTNPRMEIRAIGSNDVIRSYPLDQFDFNKLFTDTWVATSIDGFNFNKYFEESWSVKLPKLFQIPSAEQVGG